MLRRLSIRDIVLIDRLELEFGPGLCALTGETGAGKSIVLDALGLALGARSDGALLRGGAAQGSVSAAFNFGPDHPARDLLAERGIAIEDELVLRRVLGKDGRSRGFVNDEPVGVALLRRLGDALVEIEGQSEDRGLADTGTHRALLDEFGNLHDEIAAVTAAHDDWRAAGAAVDAAREALEQARRDEDYLRHSLAELDTLKPVPGEEQALTAERTRLGNGRKIVDALREAEAAFAAEDPASNRLRVAQRALERVAGAAGGGLDEAIAALERAVLEAAEAESQLQAASGALDLDPRRLDEVEERLFSVRAAARKHQTDADSLAALRARIADQLSSLDAGAEQLAELDSERVRAEARLNAAAATLSAARRGAAAALDEAMGGELAPLKLGDAVFRMRLEALAHGEVSRHGAERVSFEVSANPGTPPGPLGKIASGGERSRFLLVLKVVLARVNRTPTLVFDEADRGIGGAVADAVGERLARLACGVQVLVVTHSPQVAARADHHLRVSKTASGDRVQIAVDALDGAGKREEIARMLSGARTTDAARTAADSLIHANR